EESKEHAGGAVTAAINDRHTTEAEPELGRPAPIAVPRDYVRRIVGIMADVADAVHYVHEAGIIHRDLKPANILVERQGHPWVLDFGLAPLRGELQAAASPRISDEAPSMGPPSVGVGTPLYWAPEQVPSFRRPAQESTPHPIDHRTDVWGLGATLYELLTLRR